ncbi:hypothetical protein BV898_11453 [Hypsibius exemplaris]|uniref:VWFA domain-containing protein n=1 Tax=Hypsibius exemplaris TaxID=2072580 RepID=A0A1W0WGK8_HYPEX|nr:hypothetical protein BV898_11453 [Hypsibius exemplaris]
MPPKRSTRVGTSRSVVTPPTAPAAAPADVVATPVAKRTRGSAAAAAAANPDPVSTSPPTKRAKSTPAKKASGGMVSVATTAATPVTGTPSATSTNVTPTTSSATTVNPTTVNPTTVSPTTTTTTASVPTTGAIVADGSMPDIDVVISFDTTGSMGSCINEVRHHVQALIGRLFSELVTLRIGVVAHGDYDHGDMLCKQLDLTDRPATVVGFITATANSGGGCTWPEAYEYVLREVRKMSWRPAAIRALVMIGDSYPHEANDNPFNLDWKFECDELKKMNVAIYAVQCLNSGAAKNLNFYRTIAEKTNGYHIFLDQFSYVRDMLLAVAFRQCGQVRLTAYEQELVARPRGMTQSMRRMFDTMLGRQSAVLDINFDGSTSVTDLRPCPPSKYQVLEVTAAVSIKAFVQSEGLTFKTGKGFYEFTKPEQISAKKEIVLMKTSTGELFEGAAARAIAGITAANEARKVAPGVGALGQYRAFVQSTSVNRKLVAGTGFLYEAEDYGQAE